MTAPELTYAQARARALDGLAPLAPVRAPLAALRGRALREPIVAPHGLPPFANSAMDGWAVRTVDLAGASPGAPRTLPVVAVIAAGAVPPRALEPGEAMRIMTGAMLPAGADAIVPFEHGTRGGGPDGETMTTGEPPRPGEHVRAADADVAPGKLVLSPGRALSPHDIALLASLGYPEVLAGPEPRVAVLSTGDELLAPGDALRPGAIRDSNLPMLASLVEEAGATVTIGAHLPDDAARVLAAVEDALERADVVLTIGGVSAGDFDPVKEALRSRGGIELGRVAMRPGRPQAFGRPGGRVYFGLPGNPGSVACVFEALVRPALRRLQGFADVDRPRVPVRMAHDLASRSGRTDFVRCELAWRDGGLVATAAGAQVSGHLAPQSRAHALVVVPHEAEALRAGETAEALVLRLPGAMA